ncbi:MAG TPA: chemotaxis protein CheX [Desulfobulbus sp.]|nr:chemotaxis protein CheX [Desulfobulbus sp.]
MPSVERYITEATIEVFATMIFLDITPGAPIIRKDDTLDTNLTSMIGLAGDLKGVLAVHCPAETAKGITGAMLGMDVEELDEDVKDAIGEIANMVAGGLKVALAADDIHTELAIPTTILGTAVRTSGQSGIARFIIPFTTSAGAFGIELQYALH